MDASLHYLPVVKQSEGGAHVPTTGSQQILVQELLPHMCVPYVEVTYTREAEECTMSFGYTFSEVED